ncbi:hypothetical protein [Pseudoalteromonas luteoviolacea]|uniref:Uncharacterized protein n=1 Tax=Pseudoalteromonas luteoviolacea S4060-1 TaxID=1365257 RepID=A0A162AXL8_9GAMM|nr:hypothetical protein [Pseudoalteromonas luteoviolacea]KZN63352.1 hypothetical protein N478_03620 [Pseudoalteromonas luteoviolacea S4060-1]
MDVLRKSLNMQRIRAVTSAIFFGFTLIPAGFGLIIMIMFFQGVENVFEVGAIITVDDVDALRELGEFVRSLFYLSCVVSMLGIPFALNRLK